MGFQKDSGLGFSMFLCGLVAVAPGRNIREYLDLGSFSRYGSSIHMRMMMICP